MAIFFHFSTDLSLKVFKEKEEDFHDARSDEKQPFFWSGLINKMHLRVLVFTLNAALAGYLLHPNIIHHHGGLILACCSKVKFDIMIHQCCPLSNSLVLHSRIMQTHWQCLNS